MASSSFSHRAGTPDDIATCIELEQKTAELFIPYGLGDALTDNNTPRSTFLHAIALGDLWVTEVVGSAQIEAFLLLSRHTEQSGVRLLHIDEVHVNPELMRQGMGTSLVNLTEGRAREIGASEVTLVTIEFVPWNAPFYRKLGYRTLKRFELHPHLADLLGVPQGIPFGLDGRVAMAKKIPI